jgi:hypothetical protein
MTTPADLMNQLRGLGVTVCAEDGELVIRPGNKVPPALVPELKEHKAALLSLLSRMCFCPSPMPSAVINGPECQQCHLSGWCQTCGGCRWCAFQLRWKDRLEPKYK